MVLSFLYGIRPPRLGFEELDASRQFTVVTGHSWQGDIGSIKLPHERLHGLDVSDLCSNERLSLDLLQLTLMASGAHNVTFEGDECPATVPSCTPKEVIGTRPF